MAIISRRSVTPAMRFRLDLSRAPITKDYPEKSLVTLLPKKSGRNNTGHVTVRHQGGRKKRYYRVIDFKRNKFNIPGKVAAIEYDPNRTVFVALIQYADGEKRYILSPNDLKVGDAILSGEFTEIKPGNALKLKNIPVGTFIHNIELKPGKGGQIVRSAGNAAIIMSRDENGVVVKLPSSEVRLFSGNCMATVGQLGNADHSNVKLGKAGRSRHMGIRPHVRGVAMSPRKHPHGGGEGKSGIGMKTPKSFYGKKTLGVRTRKRNHPTNKFIISRRKR